MASKSEFSRKLLPVADPVLGQSLLRDPAWRIWICQPALRQISRTLSQNSLPKKLWTCFLHRHPLQALMPTPNHCTSNFYITSDLWLFCVSGHCPHCWKRVFAWEALTLSAEQPLTFFSVNPNQTSRPRRRFWIYLVALDLWDNDFPWLSNALMCFPWTTPIKC